MVKVISLIICMLSFVNAVQTVVQQFRILVPRGTGKTARSREEQVSVLPIYWRSTHFLSEAAVSFVSMAAGNEIECRGPLPDYQLPLPYHTSDFENLQQMCAVEWSGGNK